MKRKTRNATPAAMPDAVPAARYTGRGNSYTLHNDRARRAALEVADIFRNAAAAVRDMPAAVVIGNSKKSGPVYAYPADIVSDIFRADFDARRACNAAANSNDLRTIARNADAVAAALLTAKTLYKHLMFVSDRAEKTGRYSAIKTGDIYAAAADATIGKNKWLYAENGSENNLRHWNIAKDIRRRVSVADGNLSAWLMRQNVTYFNREKTDTIVTLTGKEIKVKNGEYTHVKRIAENTNNDVLPDTYAQVNNGVLYLISNAAARQTARNVARDQKKPYFLRNVHFKLKRNAAARVKSALRAYNAGKANKYTRALIIAQCGVNAENNAWRTARRTIKNGDKLPDYIPHGIGGKETKAAPRQTEFNVLSLDAIVSFQPVGTSTPAFDNAAADMVTDKSFDVAADENPVSFDDVLSEIEKLSITDGQYCLLKTVALFGFEKYTDIARFWIAHKDFAPAYALNRIDDHSGTEKSLVQSIAKKISADSDALRNMPAVYEICTGTTTPARRCNLKPIETFFTDIGADRYDDYMSAKKAISEKIAKLDAAAAPADKYRKILFSRVPAHDVILTTFSATPAATPDAAADMPMYVDAAAVREYYNARRNDVSELLKKESAARRAEKHLSFEKWLIEHKHIEKEKAAAIAARMGLAE